MVGMRLGGLSPARGPEASGWETRFLCSMKGSGVTVMARFLFGDECRSGNSALLMGVGACYVQCSLGGAIGTRSTHDDRAFGVIRES